MPLPAVQSNSIRVSLQSHRICVCTVFFCHGIGVQPCVCFSHASRDFLPRSLTRLLRLLPTSRTISGRLHAAHRQACVGADSHGQPKY